MKWRMSFRNMKIAALSLAVAASLTGVAGTGTSVFAAEAGVTQPYESLLQGDRIIDVKLTISDEDWKSILASPLEKDYKKVSVEVDGNKLDNVGFSTKGNMTLNSVASMKDSDRYSFRLKFDKYDKNQTLLGLDKMVLNNNYTDPSYLREYLHYEALRSIGEDAPLTVFVNLYINGKLYGFYTGVESVDDSYLERNFGDSSKDGVLYDTDEKSYLKYEEGSNYDSITKDSGTDDNKAALKNFIKVLNDMPTGEKGDIESVLDVDSALKYIAANAVLGNYDSYNGDKGHNYELYGDKNGKFTVIPWDMNMSFNGFGGGGGRASGSSTTSTTSSDLASDKVNKDAVSASVDDPTLGISLDKVPMINNLLKVPEYKTKYLGYVKQLVNYMEGIGDRIDNLADLIRPYVEADPTKFYTMDQFESNVAYSTSSEAAGQGAGGFGGNMTPPDGQMPEGMEPPEGFQPPDGSEPPERPGGETAASGPNGDKGQGPGQSMGMGMMAAGSLKTFALNRLVNLEKQLGLEVTNLPADETPSSTGETSAGGTSTTGATSSAGATASPSEGIQVSLNGKTVVFADQRPIKKEGSVWVPASAILKAWGAKVTWDQASQTVTAVNGDKTVKLINGSSTVSVNGSSVKLQAPVSTQSNRVMLPVRSLADALNLDMNWDEALQTVTMKRK